MVMLLVILFVLGVVKVWFVLVVNVRIRYVFRYVFLCMN